MVSAIKTTLVDLGEIMYRSQLRKTLHKGLPGGGGGWAILVVVGGNPIEGCIDSEECVSTMCFHSERGVSTHTYSPPEGVFSLRRERFSSGYRGSSITGVQAAPKSCCAEGFIAHLLWPRRVVF